MSEAGVDRCMARLDVAYPHHFKRDDVDADFALQVYHEILDDVDDDLLMAATLQWLSTKRPFHPAPGELRDLALSLINRNEPSADEAWIEVIDAMRKLGSYRLPAWSSARIEKTVRAFGWKELCATDNEQIPFIRSQFLKIYQAQADREHDAQLMLPEVKERIAQVAEQKRIGIEGPK